MFGFFKKKSEPKELKAMVNGEVISVTEVRMMYSPPVC